MKKSLQNLKVEWKHVVVVLRGFGPLFSEYQGTPLKTAIFVSKGPSFPGCQEPANYRWFCVCMFFFSFFRQHSSNPKASLHSQYDVSTCIITYIGTFQSCSLRFSKRNKHDYRLNMFWIISFNYGLSMILINSELCKHVKTGNVWNNLTTV